MVFYLLFFHGYNAFSRRNQGHAEVPAGSRFVEGAGVARTTPAGIIVGSGAAALTHASGASTIDDPQAATPAVVGASSAPARPFYKKRWFIISQSILIPISIALLFILLFPVVKAIVQLVVKRSKLGVTVAAITQPQNDT